MAIKVKRSKWYPNPRARGKRGGKVWKKKHKETGDEGDNLEDTVEMSKEELIASRPREIQLREKVSTNTEGEESSKLMQTDTLSSFLMMKSLKRTVPTTTHKVVDGHNVVVTTHESASTPIVSLKTEREKMSTSHAKQTWTSALKDSLPQVETPKTKKEVKRKQKVSMNTDTGSRPQAPNINKIPMPQKPKPQ